MKIFNKLVGGGQGEISSRICNVKKLSRRIKKGINEVEYPHSPHKNMETLEKIPYNIMGKSH